tara:strand:- start:226 stop:372 length:147 start_codon:yes stop_codon:yes gene_type:complete
MKREIIKEILNNLDDVYSIIINNNKESKKIIKILSLIDELQTEIYDLE